MDATCTIQDSIHVFSLVHKYVSRILGTYQDASFFLCKELISGYLDGVTGEYAPPEGYFVDEKAVEEFDRQFLYKEKKTLPGQIFS